MLINPLFHRIILAALMFSNPSVAARRALSSNESISRHLREDGRDQSSFTITAEVTGGAANAFTSPGTVSVDVIVANPAITQDTFVVLEDGTPIQFRESTNNILDDLLVSDTTTSAGRSGLTILAVDPITHKTQGIIEQKGGKSMKLYQGSEGGVVTAVHEEKMEMPAWECGVGKEETLFHRVLDDEAHHHHHHDHQEEDMQNHHHHHEHDHHHHDHDHDEYDPSKSAIENLSRSLRGTKINPLNKQRNLDASLPYSYQVDLFIEIDTEFIAKTGGGPVDAAGITSGAYNYINTLVTAANVIYESEIDTHLHVHTIKLSTLYDSSTSTNDALTRMKDNYGGTSWHTDEIDLQHALLGLELGGGIAYIGTVCNPDYGFGLSSGLNGDFTSLDQRVVWDLKAFMHEIGHSFSSGHTHDTNYYSPSIDTCGTSCPSTAGHQWSTIMSYCHGCPGDTDNLMYTFGGIYDGSGPKSDIANWIDKPELIANEDSTHKNIDPHREAHAMYSHVSSRGSCVFRPAPEVPVTLATYDSTLNVPRCVDSVESCSSGVLLNGRASLGPKEQGHSPSTLQASCSDGTNGSYLTDESLEAIKVSSTNGGLLRSGDIAEIEAAVYSFDRNADSADFYYSTNPLNPMWTLIGTANPPERGAQTIKMQYTLPVGELQAVRVVFRYQGSASTSIPFQCPSSGYDDVDDLVFKVADKVTSSPTVSSTTTPSSSPSSSPVATEVTSSPTVSSTTTPSSSPSSSPVATPTTDNPTTSPTVPLTCYNARKVRLESTTGENIQIFELKVTSAGENVALQGTATQSSDWNDRFTAVKAIDGDETTFSHTNDLNAFLEVELSEVRSIDEVVIINRWCANAGDPHSCLCRLSHANLSLVDGDGSIIVTRQLGDTCGVLSISEAFVSDLGCVPTTEDTATTKSTNTNNPTNSPTESSTTAPSSGPTTNSPVTTPSSSTQPPSVPTTNSPVTTQSSSTQPPTRHVGTKAAKRAKSVV